MREAATSSYEAHVMRASVYFEVGIFIVVAGSRFCQDRKQLELVPSLSALARVDCFYFLP